jgi:hypothetical protein
MDERKKKKKSRRGQGCLSLVSVVSCQVQVSVSGRSPIQRSPTECGVSECNHEASLMRSSGGCCAMEGIDCFRFLDRRHHDFLYVVNQIKIFCENRPWLLDLC